MFDRCDKNEFSSVFRRFTGFDHPERHEPLYSMSQPHVSPYRRAPQTHLTSLLTKMTSGEKSKGHTHTEECPIISLCPEPQVRLVSAAGH